jgi:outer membrane protein
MHQLKSFIATVLLASIHTVALAQKGPVLTLQQCVDTALARNLRVQQAGLREQTADVNRDQAKWNKLPAANANIFHGSNEGRSIDPFTNGYVNQQINYANYGIGSNVTLFNGLSLQHTQRSAGYAYQAARLETEQERDNLTMLVMLAYLQVLNNEDLVAQARINAGVTQKQVERLNVLNSQGAIAPPLVQELTGQLQNEKVRIVEAQNALELSRLSLAQLMNAPYDPAVQLERLPATMQMPHNTDNISALIEKAEAQWPQVQAMNLRHKSALYAVKAEQGRRFPRLVMGGNVNSTYSSAARREVLLNTTEKATGNYVLLNGDKLPVFVQQGQYTSREIGYFSQMRNNIYSNVELGLVVPLFNGMLTRNRVRLARIEAQNWALQEQSTRIQLRNDIDQAAIQLQTARERTHTLQEGVRAFSEAFRAAEVRFNAGVGTVVDYLIAKNNLDQANANLVRAQYDFVLRQKVLNFYLNRKLQ